MAIEGERTISRYTTNAVTEINAAAQELHKAVGGMATREAMEAVADAGFLRIAAELVGMIGAKYEPAGPERK